MPETRSIVMIEYKHISQNGKETLLYELPLGHLINIIAKIERDAEEGILRPIIILNDRDYEKGEEIINGQSVLDYLNYDLYVNELKRRQGNDQSNHAN